jgi:mannose-6-phosphate isomerase
MIDHRIGKGQRQRRVDKPWGWEAIWAETEYYVGKILHVRAGHRLSLQYHDQKTESQYLLSGRAQLLLDDADGVLQTILMETGACYTIVPFQRHRIIALDDSEILEVSTPERGITYRIEDDFGRSHEQRDL